jgi:hypothetical protein
MAVIVSCSGLRERTVTQCHNGDILTARDELDRATMNVIHGALVKHQAYPGAASKCIVQPLDLCSKDILVGREIRYKNGEAVRHPTKVSVFLLRTGEVLRRQPIAFGRV